MDHNSPLVGGELYALRAGRCGCDSLSLAGSRQRVKSLRSSVRLRLVFYTARSILSGIDFGCAFVKSFKGSQESETASCGRRLARGRIYVRQRYSSLRSVPSFPQVVTAFRSSLPSAATTCYAPQSSTESSEPSGRLLVPRRLPPVSAALPVPDCSATTTELTLRRLPDSPVPMSLPPLPLFR